MALFDFFKASSQPIPGPLAAQQTNPYLSSLFAMNPAKFGQKPPLLPQQQMSAPSGILGVQQAQEQQSQAPLTAQPASSPLPTPAQEQPPQKPGLMQRLTDFATSNEGRAWAGAMMKAGGYSDRPITLGEAWANANDAMSAAKQQELERQQQQEELDFKRMQMQGELMGANAKTEEVRRKIEAQQRIAELTAARNRGEISDEQFRNELGSSILAGGDVKEGLSILGVGGETDIQRNLIAAGFKPGTPEFSQAMMQSILKPSTQINMGDNKQFEIPSGYMLKNPENPSEGVVPIPGAGTDKENMVDANKIAMFQAVQSTLPTINSLVYDKNGKVDRTNLATSNVPFIGGIPFTEGGKLDTYFETGIQAITRGLTGANMPPEELDNTKKMFMPQAHDDDSVVQAKLNMYQDFINGTLQLVDPSGRFNSDRFKNELEKRRIAFGEEDQAQSTQKTQDQQSNDEPNQPVDYSQDDLEHTAKQYGISVDQVKQMMSSAKKKDSGGQLMTPAQQSRIESLGLNQNDPFVHLIKQESGGQQFKNGKTIESPKGALGVAQVMPKTAPEAAQDAGLPFDEHAYKNDAKYNAAIGKAYFAKMLDTFNGNVEYAAAAYNAGAGAVRKAIKAGGANWRDELPAETRDYIKKTVKADKKQLSPEELQNYLLAAAPGYAERVGVAKRRFA